MTDRPNYWNPTHFKPGQRVLYGEFEAAIESHYSEGMWNVRLPGGSACVSGASLVPVGAPPMPLRSISDDDLCSACKHCTYKPGEMSGCAKAWPGVGGDYVEACVEFVMGEQEAEAQLVLWGVHPTIEFGVVAQVFGLDHSFVWTKETLAGYVADYKAVVASAIHDGLAAGIERLALRQLVAEVGGAYQGFDPTKTDLALAELVRTALGLQSQLPSPNDWLVESDQ